MRFTPKFALAALSVAIFFGTIEFVLRPFATLGVRTTIFERDPDLGWKYRPGADDLWDGVRMTINAKGLRGPDIPYAKAAGTFRILFLGDSVTVGWGLRFPDTFPGLAARALERASGTRVEAVNAGVNGYSPWQEATYLEKEGHRYDPDLVVVSFVLNDVTERLGLLRFGGSSEGRQLAGSLLSWRDWLTDRSAFFHFAAALAARVRFGADAKHGAQAKELVDVRDLIEHPERTAVREAWALVRADLARIDELCASRGIPLVLVAFPFTIQLADPVATGAPQGELTAFAAERRIPLLDMLPLLSEDLRREGRPASDYFLDGDHPSPLGARVVASVIAEFLADHGLGRVARSRISRDQAAPSRTRRPGDALRPAWPVGPASGRTYAFSSGDISRCRARGGPRPCPGRARRASMSTRIAP